MQNPVNSVTFLITTRVSKNPIKQLTLRLFDLDHRRTLMNPQGIRTLLKRIYIYLQIHDHVHKRETKSRLNIVVFHCIFLDYNGILSLPRGFFPSRVYYIKSLASFIFLANLDHMIRISIFLAV